MDLVLDYLKALLVLLGMVVVLRPCNFQNMGSPLIFQRNDRMSLVPLYCPNVQGREEVAQYMKLAFC